MSSGSRSSGTARNLLDAAGLRVTVGAWRRTSSQAFLGRELERPWRAVDWDADSDWACSPWPDGSAPSLRRLLIDMVEEYARHVGHADLLRESIDGLVGEDPPRS